MVQEGRIGSEVIGTRVLRETKEWSKVVTTISVEIYSSYMGLDSMLSRCGSTSQNL